MAEWAAVAPNEPAAVVLATAGRRRAAVGAQRARAGLRRRGLHVLHELREPQGPATSPPTRHGALAVQLGAGAAPGRTSRGPMAPVSRAESEAYFATRPAGQPAGGVGVGTSRACSPTGPRSRPASPRPRPRFGDGEVPCPPHWGGYRLVPDEIELWQGRPNRMHDRLRYARDTRRARPAGGSSGSARSRGSGPAGRRPAASGRPMSDDAGGGSARPAGRSAQSGTVRDRVRGGSSSCTPPSARQVHRVAPVHAPQVGRDRVELVDHLVAGQRVAQVAGDVGGQRPVAARRAAAWSTARRARSRGPRRPRRRGRGTRPARASRRAVTSIDGTCHRSAVGLAHRVERGAGLPRPPRPR